MVGIAAMTRFTITRDTGVNVLRVLEWRRTGANGRISVTHRTILICRQMINCLAATDITVMTRHAVIHNAYMIKCCRYKTCGVMAQGAIFNGWQVINEFANSDHIIMAIRTKGRWVDVTGTLTKDAASKSTRGMANTAVLVCWHVVE